MATTKDAIGTLSQDEVRQWCSELIEVEDGRCDRARGIREAAAACREKHPNDTRAFFQCFAPAFSGITKGKIWHLGEWWEEEYSTADAVVYRSADGKKRLYVYWDGTKEVKPA